MIYSQKLEKAVQFSSHRHRDQKRKVLDCPYITHPLVLLYLVSKFSDDEDVLCAAVLHDVVEDTKTSLMEIKDLFGQRVFELVDLLSEDKSLEYKKRNYLYIQRLCLSEDKDALLIKGADIMYNLRDIEASINHSDYQEVQGMFYLGLEFYLEMNVKDLKSLRLAWDKNPFLGEIRDQIQRLLALK